MYNGGVLPKRTVTLSEILQQAEFDGTWGQHVVYVVDTHKEILYVGRTAANVRRRLMQHATMRSSLGRVMRQAGNYRLGWLISLFPARDAKEAAAIERSLIESERPILNTSLRSKAKGVGRPRRLVDQHSELLRLVDAGLRMKDIANHFGVAPATVRSELRRCGYLPIKRWQKYPV